MGMSIDKAIKQLTTYSIPCGKYKDAYDMAIETMRKFQRIQAIVKQKDYDRFNSHNYYGYFLRVQDIRKELEDGNDRNN